MSRAESQNHVSEEENKKAHENGQTEFIEPFLKTNSGGENFNVQANPTKKKKKKHLMEETGKLDSRGINPGVNHGEEPLKSVKRTGLKDPASVATEGGSESKRNQWRPERKKENQKKKRGSRSGKFFGGLGEKKGL